LRGRILSASGAVKVSASVSGSVSLKRVLVARRGIIILSENYLARKAISGRPGASFKPIRGLSKGILARESLAQTFVMRDTASVII
jgi:hypothetical protein